MFKAMYSNVDRFSEKFSFDKMSTASNDASAEFSIFHDYLGLVNLVKPVLSPHESLDSPMSETSSVFDYPSLEAPSRHRINSVDSDAISDSSSSAGSRDADLYDLVAAPAESMKYSTRSVMGNDINILTQSYAKTLESLIAQKNALNCLSPPLSKDSRLSKANKTTVCVFCRNNGESKEFYSSHTLKDNEGNTTCPILRAYTCPLCKANGDNSHTIKYCPKYTPKMKADKFLGISL
ncbi:nanos homolog 1-like [Hydractinia symbiolongicarpus]|uniref:nanos homolog 1-like n=1 Tax=Hydractinia symbiolongicarpus TaxID=13093 RepID=UPI00254CF6E8|nr:nanos homolog 1-like [Hydractinia symbiolongicarpus]